MDTYRRGSLKDGCQLAHAPRPIGPVILTDPRGVVVHVLDFLVFRLGSSDMNLCLSPPRMLRLDEIQIRVCADLPGAIVAVRDAEPGLVDGLGVVPVACAEAVDF